MREQQDAQELWQLMVAAVEEEGDVVRKELKGPGGVGVGWGKQGLGVLAASANQEREVVKKETKGMVNPFDGRLAYRRSCQLSVRPLT